MNVLTFKISQNGVSCDPDANQEIIKSLQEIKDIQSIEFLPSTKKIKVSFLDLQTEEKIFQVVRSQSLDIENKPFFSVILPVYNREGYIKETLDSILNQSFLDFEVIAIDDGSTDKSIEILEENAKLFANFKLIKLKHCGVSEARNKGILNAKGDFLCFMDSDDLLSRDYFLHFYQVIMQTDADVIKNTTILKFSTKSPASLKNKNLKISSIKEFYLKPSNINLGGTIWSYCIKRELVVKNSIYFLPQRIMEDEGFVYMLLPLCKKFITFKGSAYYYRQHHNSIVANAPVAFDRIKNFKDIIQWYREKNIIQKFPIPFHILYDVSIKNPSYTHYLKDSQEMLRSLKLEEFLKQNKLAYYLYTLEIKDFIKEHQKARGRFKYYLKRLLGILK
ncbi:MULTISPECIES: glycosyltransferase family 2 protein [unclassified Helicobacter]|uniref:glycosyltransferase family 2 protein n=1 Tax=unclassified Helicobacter TaxID=2593540 RepID=UPI000CF063A9|nr:MULTISPECIES: glycosyltransferase family 2 protein [unclassified Helicobacter]